MYVFGQISIKLVSFLFAFPQNIYVEEK